MEWYEPEVEQLERTILSRTAGSQVSESRPPAFYGSSSMRLWTTLAEDFDPRVVNLGFGGSTLEACVYFFERLVAPLRPRSLLLYAGDNDLGDGRGPEVVIADFRKFADQAFAALGPVPLGFVSVKLSPARYAIRDRIRRFNEQARVEIESRPSGYYVDVFSPMLDESGKPVATLYQEDGLHLNREGYRLWGRILEPYRDRIFTDSPPSSKHSSPNL